MSKFYITTPIYYVNGLPHIGAAYTSIAADILARYHRARGEKVHFLMGVDENAQKNVESALKLTPSNSPSKRGRKGKTFPPLCSPKASPPREDKGRLGGVRQIVQTYVDEMAAKWQGTWDALDISNDDFIRTTEKRHVKYVEKFWSMVKKGDIYKGKYEGLYCTGCEAYKTEADLVDGLCPDHKRAPDKLSEENYFFRLSNYRDALLKHIDTHPEFIQPEARRNEVYAYIKAHAVDFSISRKNLAWGIPVPGDPSQTIYVWFDALINYVSAVAQTPPNLPLARGGKISISPPLGVGVRGGQGWWPADLHLVGKDIIKFHCAYWPAMLMSAGLPLPRTVFAHGFFTVDGQKMSKTLGNVVDPVVIARKYGNDVLRYYLLREIPFGGDGDFSEERLRQRYNGELANGIGNLTARVLTMVEKYAGGKIPNQKNVISSEHGEREISTPGIGQGKRSLAGARDDEFIRNNKWWPQYETHMAAFELDRSLETVWAHVAELDTLIDREKPWRLAKGDADGKARLIEVLYILGENLRHIAWMLLPFMPDTAQKIFDQLGVPQETTAHTYEEAKQWGGLKSGTKINRGSALFPRLGD